MIADLSAHHSRMRRRDLLKFAGAVGFAGLLLPRGIRAIESKWTELFNGVDLRGWRFLQDGVGGEDRDHVAAVENGVIRVLGPQFTGGPAPANGHLATEHEYSDYHFRADFKWGEKRFQPRRLAKRNSGVLYHMPLEPGVVYPHCVEFQVQETDVGDAIMINTRGYPGASLGGTPAWPLQPSFVPRVYPQPEVAGGIAREQIVKMGNFERLTDWNTVEILAIGDKVAHLVNGRIVTTIFAMQRPHSTDRGQFVPMNRGRIALEIESAEIMFRRMAIRPIDDAGE